MTVPDREPLDELRAILLGSGSTDEQVAAALGRLSERRQDPRLTEMLREICQKGRTKLVIYGAIRIACEIDRQEAAALAMATFRRLRSRIAGPIAKLLAERCRDEAFPGMMKLSRSPQLQHRLTSLVFLRCLKADLTVPILIDMYRNEKNAMALRLLRRLLCKRLKSSHLPLLEKLRHELAWKMESLPELIRIASSKTGARRALPVGSEKLVQEAVGYALTLQGPERAVGSPAPTDLAPGTEADRPGDRSDARSVGRAAPAEPAPGDAGRFEAGLAPVRPRQPPEAPGPSVWRTLVPYRALLPAAAVIVAMAVLSAWVLRDASRPEVSGSARRDAILGRLGSRVEVTGVVVSVSKAERTVEVRTDKGLLVSVRFPDRESLGLTPGTKVAVEGIVKEIPSDTRVHLLGLAANAR